jgi:endoglucanase
MTITRTIIGLVILAGLMPISLSAQDDTAWIRINQMGYAAHGVKVAVLGAKVKVAITSFEIVDITTTKVVFKGKVSDDFGSYGPFIHTYRLDFSAFQQTGDFRIRAGNVVSPDFSISDQAYSGAANFALHYMRQQRSGYNPFLKDSCHTKDGYTIYGPMPDGTFVDVSGGWHDATDYLQYATTSANATYHLLAAYRDFRSVFSDRHLANGLNGKNGRADVLDEAEWGLQWLLKMHPGEDWMFNQIADDRDHAGFRLPTRDAVNYGYGPGKGRPVYFVSGTIQGLGKHKNRTTGAASTAGKFASAFALGSALFSEIDNTFAEKLKDRSMSAYSFGLAKPGVSQTAPCKAPYFYEEDNWVDDMELGAAALFQLTHNKKYFTDGLNYSVEEKVTPWIGADTARHYQWYPFHNFGHYELAMSGTAEEKKKLIGFYREGIERIWQKAKVNAFFRGVPFIWCSNNLTTSFAIQCYLYRQLSGDQQYIQLEQACFDWLLGCNPWGTSMIYGLPHHGDTPVDPHSSFSVLHQYSLDGGLVDGPVYGAIYNSLLGITLHEPDEYSAFQSTLAVYHDDAGDFSTNEPTMDGTASLVYLLAAKEHEAIKK